MARPKKDGTEARITNRRTLTELYVRKVQPEAVAFNAWDDKAPGLVLRVQPSGARALKFVYSHRGRPRWYHIGLEPLKRVNAAGTHLLGLINQVLDLSKIEAGKLELNPESVSVVPLIDEVVGTAGQLAEKNQNRLLVEAENNLGTIKVDPMRLRQILLNLLSNACKFTKQGEVKLKARRVANGGDWIELAVSDTGIGMTPEQQAKLVAV